MAGVDAMYRSRVTVSSPRSISTTPSATPPGPHKITRRED
jgi:hypothetical protein